MELCGALISATRRDPEWHVDISRAAAGGMIPTGSRLRARAGGMRE
ncbi:hypothetical protein [Methanosarcina sp. WWM596]|nr:hypothetical protein [Methanosarcina sp. WWM596]